MPSSSNEEIQFESDYNHFEDYYANYKQIMYLKEQLMPNNRKETIFINNYKLMDQLSEQLEKSKYKDEDKSEIQLKNKNSKIDLKTELSSDKEYQELLKNEQINEVKVNLFFLLQLGCTYEKEYERIISQKVVRAKRLIMQKYNINEKKIYFGPKHYCFIPLFNVEGDVFCFGAKKIKIIKHGKKEYKMLVNGIEIKNEKIFYIEHKCIKNLKEEENKYKKAKNLIKNNKSDNLNETTRINIINNSSKLSDIKNENKAFSQITHEINDTTNISVTSDNEINGQKFFDDQYRYIYQSYNKQISGVYYRHRPIKLYEEGTIDLLKSLDLLTTNSYDDDNDLQGHLIYKTFDSDTIKGEIPFFLEVKKSLEYLDELLYQIKEISKIIKNTHNITLPKYVIGIICSYNQKQINYQKMILNKKYKNNKKETFAENIMKIIKESGINVLIAAIRDEEISGYPLGKDDFFIENLNLSKRIDINYFNSKVCNGKYENKDLQRIIQKYPFKSFSYEIPNYCKLDKITEKYNKLKKNYKKVLENVEKIVSKAQMEEIKKIINENSDN